MATLQHPHGVVTPPHESFPCSPLTPPLSSAKSVVTEQVQEVLRASRNHQNRDPAKLSVESYQLTPENYANLLREVESEDQLATYLNDKIKYDYDPSQSILTLRLPTVVHDSFTTLLAKELSKELHRVGRENNQIHSLVEDVRQSGGRLELFGKDGSTIRRDPDIRFQHKDAVLPGIVIEVAYSQMKKSLDKLADTYILGSYGGIKTVVGIDLAYKKKPASITTWRLKTSMGDDGEEEIEAETIVNNQLFRDAEGKLVESSIGLTLSTKDLIPENFTEEIIDIPVVVPAHTLYKLLKEAEKLDSRNLRIPRPVKRKWRGSSPIDEPTISDEERALEEENRREKKMQKQDPSYSEEEA